MLAGTEVQSFDREFHIEKLGFTTETVDLMTGASRWEVKLHEHGLLALGEVMPRLVESGQTANAAIVQAAPVSYGQGTKKRHQDCGLIRYLMRHHHNTPFKMFELIQPIAPMTTEAFLDYRLNGLHLTSLELEALLSEDEGAIKNDRERAEWRAKRKMLGI